MASRPWSWLLALIEGTMQVRSRLLWERLGASGRADVRKVLGNGGDVTPWL
jgi:hypothetical protein